MTTLPDMPTVGLNELRNRLRELAQLPESTDPILSIYLDLRQGIETTVQELDRRLMILDHLLPTVRHAPLAEAAVTARSILLERNWQGVSGLALFTRGGNHPVSLQLPFSLPFENWVSVDNIPHLYPLMEMKDTHDRYFLLLLGVESVRILEISLGSVSRELLVARPDLPASAGRMWGRAHYQRKSGTQPESTLGQVLKTIEKLVLTGKPAKILLAGDPMLIRQFREKMPHGLKALDTGEIDLSNPAQMEDVVRRSLLLFAEKEELESRAIAERLREAVCRNILGVVGPHGTWLALQAGQVDTLVLHEEADLPEVFRCDLCGDIRGKIACTSCGMHPCREVDLRQELVMQAERTGASVEIVKEHSWLQEHEGVGALLRYGRAPSTARHLPGRAAWP